MKADEMGRSWPEFLISNGFIAGLVAVLSVLVAVAAFQGTRAQLSGDEADNQAQNQLILANTAYIEANQIFALDMAQYEAFLLTKDVDNAAAEAFLEASSAELRQGLERANGPFDDEYMAARYQEAQEHLAQVNELQTQGDSADEQTLIYELALLVFALGLAMTGWASLADARPRVARTFVLFGIIALLAGLGTLVYAGSI